MRQLRPLHDQVIVRRKPAETITRGGIIIPESAQTKGQEGTVVAVGPGFEMPSGFRVPTGLQPGDRVVFGKHNGTDRVVDGEKLLFIVASQIEGVIEG